MKISELLENYTSRLRDHTADLALNNKNSEELSSLLYGLYLDMYDTLIAIEDDGVDLEVNVKLASEGDEYDEPL